MNVNTLNEEKSNVTDNKNRHRRRNKMNLTVGSVKLIEIVTTKQKIKIKIKILQYSIKFYNVTRHVLLKYYDTNMVEIVWQTTSSNRHRFYYTKFGRP